MTTINENLHNNKRKFISDAEIHTPSNRYLSINNQVESSCNTKKLKILETEQSSIDIDDTDDKMICENSDIKPDNTQQISHTKAIIIPQHCNRICDADPSPTTLMIRCYCDPYRLNAFLPYDSDIY